MDAIEFLNEIARACTRAENRAYWILISAASRLNGYTPESNPGNAECAESTVAYYFPIWRNLPDGWK